MIADRLGIAGVGLIGGSLGLAARRNGLFRSVLGIGRDAGRLQAAVDAGAIDAFVTDLAQGARECDVLYLATPVGTIIEQIRQLRYLRDHDLIITDGGSSKQAILEAAAALPDNMHFVGGHPMAGSHETGLEHASASMFEGATYVLTPEESTSPGALEAVEKLAVGIGARVVHLEAGEHDRAVAAISHLPHLIAGAYLRCVSRSESWAVKLAAGSFRDLTRVAASSPVLWRDIVMTNRQSIEDSLHAFEDALSEIRHLLALNDPQEVEQWFATGREIRSQLLERKEGQDE